MSSPAVTISPMTTDECSSSPLMLLGRTNSSVGASFSTTAAAVTGAFPSVSPFTPVSPAGGGYNHLLGYHGRSSFLAAPTTTPVVTSPNTPAVAKLEPNLACPTANSEEVIPPSPVSTIAGDGDREMSICRQSNTPSPSNSEEVSVSPESGKKRKHVRANSRRGGKKKQKQQRQQQIATASQASLSHSKQAADAPNEELNNTFSNSDAEAVAGPDEASSFSSSSQGDSPSSDEEPCSRRRFVKKDDVKINRTTVTTTTTTAPSCGQSMTRSHGRKRSAVSAEFPPHGAHHHAAAARPTNAPFNLSASSNAPTSGSHNSSFASIASRDPPSSSSTKGSSAQQQQKSMSIPPSSTSVKVEVDARRGHQVSHPSHLHHVKARCGQHFEGNISLGSIDQSFVMCPYEHKFDCMVFLPTQEEAPNEQQEQQEEGNSWKWMNNPYSFNVIPDTKLMLKVHAAQRDAILTSNNAMVTEVRKCFEPQVSAVINHHHHHSAPTEYSTVELSVEDTPPCQMMEGEDYSLVYSHPPTTEQRSATATAAALSSHTLNNRGDWSSPLPQLEEEEYHPSYQEQDEQQYSTTCSSASAVAGSGRRLSSIGLAEDPHRTSFYGHHHHNCVEGSTPCFGGATPQHQCTLEVYRQRRHSPPQQLSPVSLSEDNSITGQYHLNNNSNHFPPPSEFNTPPQRIPPPPSSANSSSSSPLYYPGRSNSAPQHMEGAHERVAPKAGWKKQEASSPPSSAFYNSSQNSSQSSIGGLTPHHHRSPPPPHSQFNYQQSPAAVSMTGPQQSSSGSAAGSERRSAAVWTPYLGGGNRRQHF